MADAVLLKAPRRAGDRQAARLLIVNELGHVLLVRYEEQGRSYWAMPGGGLEDGESFEQAALREASEEVGLTDVTPLPLWEATVERKSRGRRIRQQERFFLVRTMRETVARSERVARAHEAEGILEWSWWSVSDLQRTGETVYPADLAARLLGVDAKPDVAGAAHIGVSDALAKVPAQGARFATVFEHGTLSVEMYAPRGHDPQQPHTRDEVYVVAQGRGTFWDGETRRPFVPGDFLFVKAGRAHRFEEFSGDLAVWVMFYGPEGGEGA